MDQLPRLGKRELICLQLFTCNYVVSVWRGFLFLWVLGMGYVILLWHSLSLPYNYHAMEQVPGVSNATNFVLESIDPRTAHLYELAKQSGVTHKAGCFLFDEEAKKETSKEHDERLNVK